MTLVTARAPQMPHKLVNNALRACRARPHPGKTMMMKRATSVTLLSCMFLSACNSTRTGNADLTTVDDLFSARNDPIVSTSRPKAGDPKKDIVSSSGNPDQPEVEVGQLTYLIDLYYHRSQQAKDWELALPAKPTGNSPYATSQAAFLAYRKSGWDASRGICVYALDQLGESHSKYQFGNRTVRQLANFGAALMGIFKASRQAFSVYAAGDALYDAWTQNYEDYAFISPSNGQLRRLVLQAQDEYRISIEKEPPPTSWSEATLQIQAYNSFCLASGMRNLVEEAVAKAEVKGDKGNVRVLGRADLEASYKAALAISELNDRLEEADRLNEELRKVVKDEARAERARSELRARAVQLEASITALEEQAKAAGDALEAAKDASDAERRVRIDTLRSIRDAQRQTLGDLQDVRETIGRYDILIKGLGDKEQELTDQLTQKNKEIAAARTVAENAQSRDNAAATVVPGAAPNR